MDAPEVEIDNVHQWFNESGFDGRGAAITSSLGLGRLV